jgi:hypothetical protein
MTITLTKTRVAVAILVAALLAPATALAGHVFDDVDDDRFFASAVSWAYDNGITTGTSATTFSPDDAVTRGETVTFLQRYHDKLVVPGLDDLQDQIDANAMAIAANTAATEANEAAASANASALAEVAARPTTHWAAVSPDATLIGTSYPGATVETADDFGPGVFVVDFPGLEWLGDEEFECAVHATGVGLLSVPYAAILVAPGFEPPSSEILVAPLDLANPEDIEEDALVIVSVTC